jgi:hypothetical protein
LSGNRSRKLDLQQVPQRPGRHRVDRDQPGRNILVSCPCFEKAVGLDGLAAQNSQSRGNHRNAQRRRHHLELCKEQTLPGRILGRAKAG